MLEQTGYQLHQDALGILDEWLAWYVTGTLAQRGYAQSSPGTATRIVMPVSLAPDYRVGDGVVRGHFEEGKAQLCADAARGQLSAVGLWTPAPEASAGRWHRRRTGDDNCPRSHITAYFHQSGVRGRCGAGGAVLWRGALANRLREVARGLARREDSGDGARSSLALRGRTASVSHGALPAAAQDCGVEAVALERGRHTRVTAGAAFHGPTADAVSAGSGVAEASRRRRGSLGPHAPDGAAVTPAQTAAICGESGTTRSRPGSRPARNVRRARETPPFTNRTAPAVLCCPK